MSDTNGNQNSAAAGPDPATARVDVQDPLPETNWFWRRVYTFTLSLISIALVIYGAQVLHELKDNENVYRVTRYMIGVHVLLITYYMLAPSAEQMVKLIQTAKLLGAGVPITRKAVAETPDGGRTEVTTTAGAPAPPEPPIAAPAAPEADEQDYAPRSRS